MKIITASISNAELKEMSKNMFDNLVKAVVDVEKEIMAIDAGLHSDEEIMLLKNGSAQENLWGINIYPDSYGSDQWIEYDSMINIRPLQNNRSRGVENHQTQEKIKKIVTRLVTK